MNVQSGKRIIHQLVGCMAIALLGIPQVNASTYNANQEFVDSEAGLGLSTFGNFSLGYALPGSPDSFKIFGAPDEGVHTDSWAGNPNLEGWFVDNNVIVPAIVVNTSTSNATTFFGVTVAPSQILMHGGGVGDNGYVQPFYDAVLRFTVPTSGKYEIKGIWTQLHSGITSQIVRINNTILQSNNGGTNTFNYTPILNAGDHIDFVVNDLDGIGSDSTGLTASIAAVPEPSTLALLGFGGISIAFGAYRKRRKNAQLAV